MWRAEIVRTLIQILLVAVGSSIGGVARYGVGVWFGRWFSSGFPWGTLFINLSGSLFLGWFMTVLDQKLALSEIAWLPSDDLKLLVGVGFTGAYTTFSTFEYEASGLLREGNTLSAAAYVAVSVFLGFLAVRYGVYLGRVR
jgi:CrcB protein